MLRDRKRDCYTVFVAGITHSTGDSALAFTDDGLSLAVARADDRARREQKAALA